MAVTPTTHLEKSIAGAVQPVTHLEKAIAGTVEPVTHLERVISEYGGGGGGGEAVLIQKTITANGTFAAADDNADGFSSVTVNVAGGLAYIQHHQYVHATDWSTGSTGNSKALCITYCNLGTGVYWVYISNNLLDDNYRGLYATVGRKSTNNNAADIFAGVFTRYASTNTNWGASVSFLIAAGAVIDVYYVPSDFGGAV